MDSLTYLLGFSSRCWSLLPNQLGHRDLDLMLICLRKGCAQRKNNYRVETGRSFLGMDLSVLVL